MHNLNDHGICGNNPQSHWDQLDFWFDSLRYWEDNLACYGDQDGFYQRSLDSANEMINLFLFSD